MTISTQIQTYIETLPTTTACIRIRIGDTTLQTVGLVAILNGGYSDSPNSEFAAQIVERDELLDVVSDVLESNGYGTEFRKARLHACNSKGKCIKSKAITAVHGRLATQSGGDRAIEKLTDGFISMAMELRKTVATLSESLAWSEEQKREAEQSALEARVSAIDNEGYARLLEALQTDEGASDPMRDHAASMLSNIVSMFSNGNIGAPPSRETVKQWVSNPEFVREMMSDPDIALHFMSAFENNEESNME